MIPSLLPDFSNATILVAGDLILDRYWHGQVSRISPEAPVPVLAVKRQEARPGGAGNVACNLHALGVNVRLLSCVGRDADGETLLKTLREAGINCDQVAQHDSQHTTTKLRTLSRNQQMLRLDFEQPEHNVPVLEGPPHVELLQDLDAILISDYSKGAISDPQPLILKARENGIPLLVNSKRADLHAYQGAFLLTLNLAEFSAATGTSVNTVNEISEPGLRLAKQLGLQALLVTCGSQGMSLLCTGSSPLHLPAHTQKVYDVTGAGDTVIAVLSAFLAAQRDETPYQKIPQHSLTAGVHLANLAAGIAVGQPGAVAIRTDELQQAIHRAAPKAVSPQTASPKTATVGCILRDRSTARQQIVAAQARGERVVFSNGCFDILHPGHIHCLKQAAALGERLIVALNSDDSIRRLKGTERPIHPLEQRMTIMAALEMVDWVIDFDEDTPVELLEILRPDILTKGGDYRLEEIAGREQVESYGGKVCTIPHLPEYSTSRILQKIVRQKDE